VDPTRCIKNGHYELVSAFGLVYFGTKMVH